MGGCPGWFATAGLLTVDILLCPGICPCICCMLFAIGCAGGMFICDPMVLGTLI